MSQRVLNWRPDLPDIRDKRYRAPLKIGTTEVMPSAVDLRPKCPPVVDQGQMGSCTGNALAGYMGFLELKEIQNADPGPEEFPSVSFEAYSRLFIYWNEREMEGRPEQDSGAAIRDGIKTLARFGGCRESLWAYDGALLFKRPGASAYAEAKDHCITAYERVDNTDINLIKQCLAGGDPVVFGFTVYESFMKPDTAQAGIVSMPGYYESVVGGHAVLAVGYDDIKQVVIVRNSWGPTWGDKGYFYLPYPYITSDDLANDFWRVSR